MPDRTRERVINTIASVILCTCVASSASYMSRDSVADLSVRSSVRPSAQFYGRASVTSMFAVKRPQYISGDQRKKAVAAKSVIPDEDKGSRSGTEITRRSPATWADGDLLSSSVALICVSVLAVTICAAVGIALLSALLGPARSRAPLDGSSCFEKDEVGRGVHPFNNLSSSSLGTQQVISL
jgi:hypothetical protein